MVAQASILLLDTTRCRNTNDVMCTYYAILKQALECLRDE